MSLPPGPRSPRAIQQWHWLRHPTGLLEKCCARYGEIFTFRPLWGEDMVITSNPEAIRQIFAAGYDEVCHPIDEEFAEIVGRTSLFLLDGREHLRLRRLVMTAFHGGRIQAHADVIHDLAEEAIDSWPLSVPFRIHPAIQHLTLLVMLYTLMGERRGPRLGELARLFTEVFTFHGSPFVLVPIGLQRRLGMGPWARAIRLVRQADEILYQEIRQRRTSTETCGPDTLSQLILARDEGGQPLTDHEVRDALFALLIAGYDTTTHALTWAIHGLLREPGLCLRLEEELRTARQGGALIAERVLSLPLLDATVREVLRLYPVFPLVFRTLSTPMRLLGHQVPAGWRVAPCIHLVHRRPDVFPDPLRFLPERFLGQRPTPQEWMPFGGGIRRCVGSTSALMQMKLVLGSILNRTRLLQVPGPQVRPVWHFFSLVPSGGVPAVLLSRESTVGLGQPAPDQLDLEAVAAGARLDQVAAP